MAAESSPVKLENGENKEENNENEKEKKEKLVVEEGGEKKEERVHQDKPRNQPQNWPRPQNRPLPQQVQNSQPFQQDLSNQPDFQDRRKAVTFGPAVRKDLPPENRPPNQQGVVIRRPSPWAVLRAKLPTGENLPILRPGITNEHIIHRMQNPEAATRPPSRPPLSRPGSQESVRPPYIQRSDSVVGRPPTSPRPPTNPTRPPSRTSMSSKDEEDEVSPNEMRGGQPFSQSRPPSGQKGPGPQIMHQPHQQPTVAQSPIIQIASNPPNIPSSPQVINQPTRMHSSPIPPNTQPQVQNHMSQLQNQMVTPHMQAPPMSQVQSASPQNMGQTTPPSNKPQVPIPSNQPTGQLNQVQGQQPLNMTSQSGPQQSMTPPHSQQPLSQAQAPISTNNGPTSQGLGPAPTGTTTVNQSPPQNPPSPAPQLPTPVSSPQPSTTQHSPLPPSPVGAKRPSSAHSTNQMQSPPPLKSQQPQKQEVLVTNKDENKQEQELPLERKLTQEKLNKNQNDNKPSANDNNKEKNEKDTPKKINGLQEKPQHKPPIIVDAMLKRPMKLKAEEINNQQAKENEPPKPESPKKENTSTKVQEPAIVNGNHESPKKSKAAPPKKLGTAQSPLKSPIKPSPKTPETPGTADKKKVPMNKVQVGAAPSPNLKSVKSKIGSLENANHKPGGGHVKIEHRKLNFNAGSKIEAKNDTYSPGGGDKKIQQVKLQWNAKPKVGSLDNAAHKPGGGDKKIESVKLDFKDKAKPKVGSKDNIKHIAGGGTVKIEDQKLDIKAQSKIGSLDNVKYKPGGGDKKIFDDKDYLKQMASTSMDSINQERKKRSRCNSTSSQESRYKSEDRASSRLSQKSEGQKELLKEKSPQRPTDQNSNQVNDKTISEDHLKSQKDGQPSERGTTKIQPLKANDINHYNLKKDANGNGKVQEIITNDIEGKGTKQNAQSNERQAYPSSHSKPFEKQFPTAPMSTDDKKSKVSQPHYMPTTQPSTEHPSSINSKEATNTSQVRQNVPSSMPRPQVSPSNTNGQKNITGLPPNIRLARDLINEREGIIEKSQTEISEKEINLPPKMAGQISSK